MVTKWLEPMSDETEKIKIYVLGKDYTEMKEYLKGLGYVVLEPHQVLTLTDGLRAFLWKDAGNMVIRVQLDC